MKKLMNSADTLVADWLDGFSAAHSDIVVMAPGRKFVRRRQPALGKVALISGGGSGHEPLHVGFVGRGMLDAACPGQIFTSPTPDQIAEAAHELGGEAGVLFIVKNYEGDRMNFEMAAEMVSCRRETLVVDDDVSDEATARGMGRRGVAGTMIVEKIVGAAAEAGADLDACRALGEKVKARTRSIGVALSYCTLPTEGERSFLLGPDEMELGVEIHGEPGRRKVKFEKADAIAEELTGAIVADLASPTSGEALLLINGFGGSPLIELYVMYNSARLSLERRGVRVVRSLVGNFVTSLDMTGLLGHGQSVGSPNGAALGQSRAHRRAALVIEASIYGRRARDRHCPAPGDPQRPCGIGKSRAQTARALRHNIAEPRCACAFELRTSESSCAPQPFGASVVAHGDLRRTAIAICRHATGRRWVVAPASPDDIFSIERPPELWAGGRALPSGGRMRRNYLET